MSKMKSLFRTKLIFIYLALSLFFFFGFAQSSFAATYYWVGSSGGNVASTTNWHTSLAACGTSGNASALSSSDIFNFSSTCTSNATISADWTVNTVNLNAGYTGTVSGNAGIKLSTRNLTQAAGTLTLTTLEQPRANGTITFTAGTRTISTYLSTESVGSGGTLTVGSGQVVTFTDINVSGSGSPQVVFSGAGILNTTNFTFLSGTNAYLNNSLALNVTGNITTVDTMITAGGVTSAINLTGTSTQTLTINSSANLVVTLTVNKPSGLVDIVGSGTLGVGTFNLTQGTTTSGYLKASTLTQTAGSLTVTTLEHARANTTFTFTAGTRTIGTYLSTANGSHAGTISVASGQIVNFSDMQITGSGGYMAISGAGTVNTADLTFLSGTTAYFSSGTLNVTGDITTVSTIVGNSSGTINLTSTSSQSLIVENTTRLASTFVVNKSAGTVTVSGSQPLYVGTFTLTQGTITASKIIFNNLTQTAGTLNVSTLENVRNNGTVAFNGGTRSISTFLSSGTNYSSITVAVGQTVQFPLVQITGSAYLNLPGAGTGSLVMGDIEFVIGSTAYFGTGVGTSTGNITMLSTQGGNHNNLTLNLTGTSTQNITQGNSNYYFASVLNINKTAGTVNIAGANKLIVFTLVLTQGTLSGSRLDVERLTQNGGVINLTTLEHRRASSHITINGGTRSIDTYVSYANANNYASIIVAVGQTLVFAEMRISGVGYLNFPASGTGSLTTGNFIFEDASPTYLGSGVLSVTGNITTVSTMVTNGTATINLTGTGDQSIVSNSPATLASAFAVNKSTGTTTVSGASFKVGIFTLTQGIFINNSVTTTVTGAFTLTQGLFDNNSVSTTITGAYVQSAGTFNNHSSTSVFSSNFTLNGGTFDGGSGNITIAGILTLTTGTFKATSGLLKFTAQSSTFFIHTSGSATFNHNYGSVEFNVYNGTVNAPNEIFYNVNVNVTARTAVLILSSNTSITILGTFTQTKGYVSGANAILNIKGDGIFLSDPASNVGSALLKFNATSTQSATFNGGYLSSIYIDNYNTSVNYNASTTFANLYINSLAGSFDLGTYGMTTGNLTVASGTFNGGSGLITVNNVFTLTGGTFNSTSNTLLFTVQSVTFFIHTSGNGTFNHNNGTVEFRGRHMTMNASGETLNNLIVNTINNLSFVAITGTITVLGDFTLIMGPVNTGTINVKGNVLFYANPAANVGSATIVVNDSSTQDVAINGGYLPGINFSNANVNVEYNAPSIFNLLTVTNGSVDFGDINATTTTFTQSGGTFSTTGSLAVTGALTQSGGDLVINNLLRPRSITYAIFSGGTRTITNYLSLSNGTAWDCISGSTANPTIYIENLIISGTGGYVTKCDTGTVIFGNVTRLAGSTANLGAPFTILGDITVVDGTMAAASALSITLGTSTNQTISGNVTFSGLVKQVTSPATLYFSSGNTVTVSSGLTLSGSSASARLKLRSTTPTVQWRINPQNTRTFSYIDVMDSYNTNATVINAGSITGYVNSGNNTNWGDGGITITPNYDKTWRGTTNVWSLASNWWEGSVPTSTDTAIFSSAGSNPALYDTSVVTAPAAVQINPGYNNTITLNKNIIVDTFSQNSGTFNAATSSFRADDSVSISAGTFNAGSGTHNFNSGLTLSGGTYNGQTSTTNVNGMLTLSSGTFNASSGTTTVSGNFNRTNGTFNPNGGNLILSGDTQAIIGATTFNNLTKIVSSAATLTFPANATTTVTGTTTLMGASGQLLSLRSSDTPSKWLFDPQGGLSLGYLDVKDSNNVNASTTGANPNINAALFTGVTDASGPDSNINWTFTAPIITVSATGTQQSSTTMPVSGRYLGGAFVLQRNTGASNVTSIALTQVGSLSANNISNVTMFYKNAVDGRCSNTSTVPADAVVFNAVTSANWTAGRAVFNGSFEVGTIPVCLYTKFTLTGSISLSNVFNTVDLVINNPLVDVVSAGTTISPETAVDIDGVTIVSSNLSGAPGISLSIASSSLSMGGSTFLNWTTTLNPSSCTASGDWSGDKSVTGVNVSTGPLNAHKTFRFTLSCTNNIGTSAATVFAVVTDPRVPTLALTAYPTDPIPSGGSADIFWEVTPGEGGYPATSCIASGPTAWSVPAAKDTSGGTQGISNITASTYFNLVCGNQFGSTTKSVLVRVASAPTPTYTCANGVWTEGPNAGYPCDYSGGPGGTPVNTILDSFVLRMDDLAIDPTVFFIMSDGRYNSLYMRQGPVGSSQIIRKLTADDLHITSGSFTKLACEANNCRGLKIDLNVQKKTPDGSLQSYSTVKTFKTTAIIRNN